MDGLDKVVLFESFEKQNEFLKAVFDPKYTFVVYGGAIRGGKTFAGLGGLILLCLKYPGSRWAVVRKDSMTLKRNTLPAWEKIRPSNIIKSYNGETMTVTFVNGSQIIFFSENYEKDKELNRWKGLEVNGFLLEEINELQSISYEKAIERAGSYVIPNLATHEQPAPVIMATCNPTQGWVKQLIYTPFKQNRLAGHMMYIASTIFDNPYIPEAYKESLKNMSRYEYEVYVLGNWDVQLKTGGEFWKGFEIDQHIGPLHIDIEEAIHISVDNNVYPYISISIWQLRKHTIQNGETEWEIFQIGEICAKDPKNTASASGYEVVKYLRKIDYQLRKVYVYGDPTTTARNTIDDNKKSFLDKFTDIINKKGYRVDKRMFKKAPPVASTGDFINEIYRNNIEGLSIIINESCKESISDYIETKEDKDGKVLKQRVKDPKTQITYEKNGHLSDTKRYFLVKCFYSEYTKFTNRFSDPIEYHFPVPNRYIRGGI